MENKINLFIVDDHQVVREGIISLIKENPQFTIVGEGSNGLDVLTQMKTMDTLPDVVLMDINMPVMDGIECTHQIFKLYKGKVKVLALTMVKQSLHIQKILKEGATGYILKNCDKLELFEAIKTVHLGKTYFSKAVSHEVMMGMVKNNSQSALATSLSKRELEVLKLIVNGLSNKEIAAELHISIRTVETHKQNIISKTGTNNVAGLVVYAIKNHLVDIS